ncbi:MAG TPA: hypothetical protein DCS91_11125 [Microcoleaceae bacterium UBA11344]|nr:hypothetical protein [Microcoleaceae cyanobacterium UBA11344]
MGLITNFPFPISHSQFPIPNFPFPISHSQFPIPNSQFPIPDSQLKKSVSLNNFFNCSQRI